MYMCICVYIYIYIYQESRVLVLARDVQRGARERGEDRARPLGAPHHDPPAGDLGALRNTVLEVHADAT